MKLLFMIILFLANLVLFAQDVKVEKLDFIAITESQKKVPHEHTYGVKDDHSSNEMEFILYILFRGYKHYFSSQDQRSCTFTPSCSVYAVETIKKKGVLVGFLDTMDRLSRCNGLSPEIYEYDVEQKLFIDYP
ncbi:MAG: membrane protein insertion efficiency factor YidD [Bacteroidales bacterium]|nr:membrane protein insertion efficiency factor YidD [Bacteroidales bacterium]